MQSIGQFIDMKKYGVLGCIEMLDKVILFVSEILPEQKEIPKVINGKPVMIQKAIFPQILSTGSYAKVGEDGENNI